jgi:VanZ family protein
MLLGLAWALLIVYASLFPFSDWRWPPGQPLVALLKLPWPPWKDPFDLWSNLLGYVPLGLLVAAAARAAARGRLSALLIAIASAAALSYVNELLQVFLPNRHPSMKDLAMNVAGAAAGACVTLVSDLVGVGRRWMTTQRRWFVPRSAGALTLLTLWPFALMFPAPLPLGLGQVVEPLREILAGWIQGVPWAESLLPVLQPADGANRPLSPLGEGLAIALGVFAPCMVGFAISYPGWRRVLFCAGAVIVAVSAMTLSTLLNFGPRHALAWLTPAAAPALVCGALAAASMLTVPRRIAAGLGLAALAASTMLVASAPADPYYASSLLAWEQGRFVRLHGLTQWVAALWPFLAICVLLGRLARND